MEAAKIAEWGFYQRVDVPQDTQDLMVQGEMSWAAFKTMRDIAVFTNKRLIIRDSQGFTGKKVEIYSIPYNSIDMWSTENAGTMDFNAEVELWTKAGRIKIKLGRHINVREVDHIIAQAVLTT